MHSKYKGKNISVLSYTSNMSMWYQHNVFFYECLPYVTNNVVFKILTLSFLFKTLKIYKNQYEIFVNILW